MATKSKRKLRFRKYPVRRGSNAPETHGGAIAVPAPDAEAQLRRSVLSCMLWEDEFYESGKTISDRIAEEAQHVPLATLAKIAVEARSEYNLRHVPLLLLTSLIKRGSGNSLVADTIFETIQRADELSELVAIYWRKGKRPLSAQMKKGLARAFTKFDAYQLGKYNQDALVKLRDVLFLVHGKPKDKTQEKVWDKLVNGKLEAPDTWEVALSGGNDKREAFTRLLGNEQMGYMALLRNLSGMKKAGVNIGLIKSSILDRKNGADRVLPFRFITAARAAPEFEPELDIALQATMADLPKMSGHTVVVLDVSGSMGVRLSSKSEVSRLDAGAALCAIVRGMSEHCTVVCTAGSDRHRKHAGAILPPRRGMALIDACHKAAEKLGGGGIFLTQMCNWLQPQVAGVDRLIVITDEQDCDSTGRGAPEDALAFGKRNYLINVASAKNGIGYGKWLHIDGFSDQAIKYIAVSEAYNDAMLANQRN